MSGKPSILSGWRADALCWVLLGVLVLLMRALIHPVGEFPLNDDWSYARAVRTWVETGQLRFTGWTSVPLIAQVVWGKLFCLPSGFSFAALRWSTITTAIFAVWGMFVLMRFAGRGRGFALAAALTLAVNPVFVNLSQTFMTDVPFTAACIWALAGFVRSFSDSRARWLWLGFLASLVATLIRHTGVVLPIAFWMSTWVTPRDASRRWAGLGCAAVVLVLAGTCWISEARWGMHPFWLRQSGRMMAGLEGGGLLRVMERLGEILLYLGLFSLPLLPLLHLRNGTRWNWRPLVWILPVSAVAAWGLSILGIWMPFAGNILYDSGLGPIRLLDVATLKLPHGMSALPVLWTGVTGVALAGVLISSVRWAALLRDSCTRIRRPSPLVLMLGLASFGWVLPMCLGGYFDRYLLVLLPVWLLSLGREDTQPSKAGSVACAGLLLLFTAFSVAATHDYFSWNRARWTALDENVIQKGIPPNQVDGGFEFNGWYAYDPVWPADLSPIPGRSWWWVTEDRVAITMGPVPGYREAAVYPFVRWLPGPDGRIRVLERTPTGLEEKKP